MDFDVMMQAIADRQDFLYRKVPRCPACNADQVQIMKKWTPAEWRCRICKHLFKHEPPPDMADSNGVRALEGK